MILIDFNGIAISSVVANITDNDAAGVSVTQSGGSTSVSEAGPTSDTYTVVLDSQPTANVTITVDPDGQTTVGAGGGNSITLTFTAGNWSTAQTVTVTAVNDAVAEGPHTAVVAHWSNSADLFYDGIPVQNSIVGIEDDDTERGGIADQESVYHEITTITIQHLVPCGAMGHLSVMFGFASLHFVRPLLSRRRLRNKIDSRR